MLSSREWDNVDRSVRGRLQNRSEDGEFWSVHHDFRLLAANGGTKCNFQLQTQRRTTNTGAGLQVV